MGGKFARNIGSRFGRLAVKWEAMPGIYILVSFSKSTVILIKILLPA